MSKTFKRNLMVIAIVLFVAVFAISGLTLALGNPAATASADDPDYIEFTVDVDQPVRYVDEGNVGDTVTVTYKITHNDGINSILLIPTYDSDVFSIASNEDITVRSTILGNPTLSQGNGTKKILLESLGENNSNNFAALDGQNETFLTITYTIIAIESGENVYEFGFDLTTQGDNNHSAAYLISEGEQKGEQTEVAITVVREHNLTLITKQNPILEIGHNAEECASVDGYGNSHDYYFTYAGHAIEVQKVNSLSEAEFNGELVVEYIYTGDATPVITWYDADYDDNDDFAPIPGNALQGAPSQAGDYIIGISAPATDAYYAVGPQYSYVHIEAQVVTVNIANKTSEYGASSRS